MSKLDMVRLGDVLRYEQPTKYLVRSEQYEDSYQTPVLTAGKSFILGYTNEQHGIFEQLPVIIFDDFTTSIKYVDFPFKVKSTAMKILHPTDKIDLKYIYFNMSRIRIDSQLHKRYWISLYANIKIHLPPLEIQQTIAKELDTITLLIEKRKAQLEKLDLLIKSKFIEMFDSLDKSKKYAYTSLDKIAKVTSGGTPSRNKQSFWNGNINWVKTTELKNNILYSSDEKITQEGLTHSSAKLCPKNTILIAMYGQGKTRGKTALLKTESTTNQACACILPSELYNTYYLWNYLILSYDNLRALAKGGNQPNLNAAMIKGFPVLLPPIELQNQFADFVLKVEQVKENMKKGLEKIELLYHSRMQEYFG